MNFLWIVCGILLLHMTSVLNVHCEEIRNDINFKEVAVDPLNQFPEGCPRDSSLTNGGCKCNHTFCEKPPCMFSLKLVTEQTDTPGSCCPTYSCEGCKEEIELDGQCPCAPDAVLKLGKVCTCIDHHKKLLNDTCVCDLGKCELPDLCDDRSVPIKISDGCCEQIKCQTCPDDSYPTSYSDLVIDDKCVCYPCPVTKCNDTYTPQIIRRGKNFPGKCCDIYNCVKQDPKMGCIVNDTVYSTGETWTSGENICTCQANGVSYCSLFNPTSESHGFRPCLFGARVYNHLDNWLLEDACTNCTCNNSESKCISHMCDIHTSEMKKSTTICPHLLDCHKKCYKGFKINEVGCTICECNVPEDKDVFDHYQQLDKLLKEYNLTENDIIDLIKTLGQGGSFTDIGSGVVTSIPTARLSSTTSTKSAAKPTAVPETNICIGGGNNTIGECAYSCILEYALPGFVIGTVLGTILVLMFRKCFERNRQKYTMYMPVGKENTVDKNLNLSTIIKQNTKNFELQSYNEKKNIN